MSTYNVSFQSAALPSSTACVRLATGSNQATLDTACAGWKFCIFFTPSTFQTWKQAGNSQAPTPEYQGGVIQWQTVAGLLEGSNATLTTGTLADCSDGNLALLDDGRGANCWIVGRVKVTA